MRHTPAKFHGGAEPLERRVLLSAASAWYQQRISALRSLHLDNPAVPELRMQKSAGSVPQQTAGPASTGLSPAQIDKYYGFSSLRFGSTTADGRGQTIALVDAYNDPSIAADLSEFDRAYNLPTAPSFKVVSETGSSTALPAPATPDSVSGSWAAEISLDVEWAHALAPGANILLVECNSQTDADLYTGAAYAATAPGVSVVSLSFGLTEADYTPAQISAIDPTFATPPGHQGVTFIAASGDRGAYADNGPLVPSYPASSPNVLAVGGTTLNVNSKGTVQNESGWSGSGGGLSTIESQNAAQLNAVGSYTARAVPDVAFDADPASGVNICDSYDFSSHTPFAVFGGTSFSAPAWASVLAITNQGRALNHTGSMDGMSQTIPHLYQAYTNGSYSQVFNDITIGDNGFYTAGKGYDLVTGLGSPIVNMLVPQLVNHIVRSTPPIIRSFSISPSVVDSGSSLTLTASNVVDSVGIVSGVKFYRPAGSQYQLIGAAVSDGHGDWSLSVSTTRLSEGIYTYEALAFNNFSNVSSPVYAANRVLVGQAVPTISLFTANPSSVSVGSTITLTATGVNDSTSEIAAVSYYLVSGSSLISLGTGTNQGGGKWTLLENTAGLTIGVHTYEAIAMAVSGLSSKASVAKNSLTLGPPRTIYVNTMLDQTDPLGSKTISLRDAIAIANSGESEVTIDFDSRVFSRLSTIYLARSTLVLSQSSAPMAIHGPAAGVDISGNGSTQVFSIQAGTIVSMSNLTIEEGFSGGNGGGLLNAGIATLTNVQVSDSTTSGLIGNGGGIDNSGNLTLIDCTVSGNHSLNGFGGGIYNSATLKLEQTTISDNTAVSGGGVANSGAATIVQSTISGNTAQSNGGGIQNYASLSVLNSTISGNSAAEAGALYNTRDFNIDTLAYATVANSTIAANVAGSTAGAIENSPDSSIRILASTISTNSAVSYGGVSNLGSATIGGSIIAKNIASSPLDQGADFSGNVLTLGRNLIGKTDGSGGWNPRYDLLGTANQPLDPGLSPLGSFGGSTQVMLPTQFSPAIGHGSRFLVPPGVTTDQRGLPRSTGGLVDIGAVQADVRTTLKLSLPSEQKAVAGKSASLNLGSLSDLLKRGPYTLIVDWGDGSVEELIAVSSTGTIAPVSHVFTLVGKLNIRVLAVDSVGNSSNLAVAIVLVATPPVSVFHRLRRL